LTDTGLATVVKERANPHPVPRIGLWSGVKIAALPINPNICLACSCSHLHWRPASSPALRPHAKRHTEKRLTSQRLGQGKVYFWRPDKTALQAGTWVNATQPLCVPSRA